MKCSLASVCLVLLLVLPGVHAIPPTLHVAWGEPDPPEAGDDYIITDTNPRFPNVELVSESLTWRIWSEDSDNPDGIGDIGVISSPYPENFGVKIEDDLGNPGAREVNGIILDPTDEAKASSLTSGRISGDLTGDVFLQRAPGGQGPRQHAAILL